MHVANGSRVELGRRGSGDKGLGRGDMLWEALFPSIRYLATNTNTMQRSILEGRDAEMRI